MTQSLNTARALLTAQNFEGARRLVNEFLEKQPDDIGCWRFRIQIEMEAENYKEALHICRNILQTHPENAGLRELEFDALAYLRKKKEARKAYEKFKTDFPHHHNCIETMQYSLDALDGETQKINRFLDEFDIDDLDFSVIRDFGITYHKMGNVFRAQQYLEKAHSHFFDDYEFNKTLAMNSLQLGRLAKARKYARIALGISPRDRHMWVLIFASYLFYLPQFYIFNAILVLANLVIGLAGIVLGFAFLFLVGIYGYETARFIEKSMSVLLDIEFLSSVYNFYFFLLAYLLVQYPNYFNFLYKRKKEVKLKRY
ncbi:MAG: tetratricopeptide repeat protein [Roseibium sp.]|uniref:tetratricopeptide repeat protein n=1 Tax=Roseibium sp. TaxID=1936156 RepID=UPI002620E752|nr:tetratricopeptide repeat protein [Roseibium sp.]MCV0429039.1 tetratricopeptide repeat protein [Roseibium sp.]